MPLFAIFVVADVFLVHQWRVVKHDVEHLNLNSAFHPYGVDKSSTNLPGWGEGGAVTSVGWQITLRDPIDKWRPVVLR